MKAKFKQDKSRGYQGAFEDAYGIHEVLLHDFAGHQFYLFKCDGDEPQNYSGDSSGTEIYYEKEGLNWKNKENRSGYVHVRADDMELIPEDNQDGHDRILESMEAYL